MLRSKAWKLICRRLLFYHKEEIVQTISIQVADLQKAYKKLTVLANELKARSILHRGVEIRTEGWN
ncbi:hypothetical protein Krac_4490 [Ktedonobacter racemifer DSM 44963]|uniref:Uncharacterized protein n=1 Tax=Ktedonobacter racemifer DSM 44963 TaxID=485913 RepID=D6TSW7_KTERA|nr:hypothetical protein Krac_4490 [Ktedonobacter racemifer DSM 44963]